MKIRRAEPHPLRDRFKMKLTRNDLRATLEVHGFRYSVEMISQWLNGYRPMPGKIEQLLWQVVEELEKGEGVA